jgi:phospholipase D1/2
VEATSNKAEETLRKLGFSQRSIAQGSKEKALANERKDFNYPGHLETGFASSVVPTEKAIVEQWSLKQVDEDHDNSAIRNQNQTIGESPADQSNCIGYENGGPRSSDVCTDSSVETGIFVNAKLPSIDNEAPSWSLKSDVSEEEQAPVGAKATIRDNRGSKFGRKNAWTLKTTKPQVDPQDFEDPISDAFWKNIWVASAVHNVRSLLSLLFMVMLANSLLAS